MLKWVIGIIMYHCSAGMVEGVFSVLSDFIQANQ